MKEILEQIDIPAENITPEVIKKGLIVRLHPNEVFWKTDSETISLNAMTGTLYHEIKHELSEMEKTQLYNGLKAGRIISVKKVEKTEKPDISLSFDSNAPTAMKLLDLPDSEFEKTITRFKRLEILELALKLEKQNRNRTDRIKFLTNHIAMVSNK